MPVPIIARIVKPQAVENLAPIIRPDAVSSPVATSP